MSEKLINIEFNVKQDELASALFFLREFIKQCRNGHHYVPPLFYEIIGKLYAEHCDLIDLKNEPTNEK